MQHTKETLAEFVTRIMRDKSLSGYDIERLSKKGITQSYVNRIKNGENDNPSVLALKALAKGLGEPEELVFSIARKTLISDDDIERIELEAMYSKRRNLSKEQWKHNVSIILP